MPVGFSSCSATSPSPPLPSVAVTTGCVFAAEQTVINNKPIAPDSEKSSKCISICLRPQSQGGEPYCCDDGSNEKGDREWLAGILLSGWGEDTLVHVHSIQNCLFVRFWNVPVWMGPSCDHGRRKRGTEDASLRPSIREISGDGPPEMMIFQ